MKAEVYIEMKCDLGESPVWDQQNQRLFWVDIVKDRLYYEEIKTKVVTYVTFHDKVGNAILMENNKVLLAIGNALYVYDLEDRTLEMIEETYLQNPKIRYNDGKCDSNGRVFIGTIHLEEEKGGEFLYRMSESGRLEPVLEGISISNGLCWNDEKKKFYYIDTPTKEIWGFDYDLETGTMSNKVVIGNIDEGDGWPDGMTIDKKGYLWVAHWGGKKLSIWDPDLKKQIDQVEIPAVNVSSCTFGGPNMDELYVTTARVGVSNEELQKYPLTGSVFRVKTDTEGLRAGRYLR